jgi:hypothetical protein
VENQDGCGGVVKSSSAYRPRRYECAQPEDNPRIIESFESYD